MKSWVAWTVLIIVACLCTLLSCSTLCISSEAFVYRLFLELAKKLMFSKLHDVLSWNLHVSSIFIFKEKGCNHFTLKSQEWFSMTILLINDEVRGACCYLAALCLTQFTRFLLSLSLEASSSLLSAEF